MAPKAKAAPPKDQAPSGAGPTESGAATPHLFIVWKADGSPAPDKLEKGAAPYLVAFHRGCMRAKAGQHEKALDFFQRAVDLNPDFAEAHCNLGVAFAKLGRRSRALTEFAIAVSLNSKFFLAASNLWMLLRGDELSRKLQDAVGSFEPDYDDPHNNLGPLAKYLATNKEMTRALGILAGTQHERLQLDVVLDAFDGWLTPGLIGRISEEEAKYVEAQQTFGFPERASDYFYEPGYVDWDEVKRFHSEQENPDFVFGAAAAELQRELSARNVAEINQEVEGKLHYTTGMDREKRTSTSAREITARRHQLPAPPPGLEWPRSRIPGVRKDQRQDDDYDLSPHFNTKGGLLRYLEDENVWGPARLRRMNLPAMRDYWPSAAKAIDNQRRNLEVEAPNLPLPTRKPKMIDEELALKPTRREPRLRVAASRRRARELSMR